jgi:hypothetical protein
MRYGSKINLTIVIGNDDFEIAKLDLELYKLLK